jgi:hypothetical protein
MRLLLSFLLAAGYLAAIQHSGSVRAGDQFLPGAAVTARQGGAKLVTCTDESGRYTLDLTPGVWEIQVELFGFRTASAKIDAGNQPTTYDWTLEMPRALDPAPAPAATGPIARTSKKPQPSAGFQSMAMQATAEGTESLAAADPPPPDLPADTDSFVVNGSTSAGLAASADEKTRREKQAKNAPPSGAQNGLSEVAATSAGGDALGLGSFGAAGVQNGFGGANPGNGGRQGGGRGRQQAAGRGGAASVTSFGNRRQNRPTYTGSLALTERNSALDAKPYSLNGQNAPKSSYG